MGNIVALKDKNVLTGNKKPLFLTSTLVVTVAVFMYYFYIPPGVDIGPEQPIPFSHRLHAGIKEVQCRFCHPYVSRSISAGIPPVGKCLYCHNFIITKHPQIVTVHRYFNNKTPISWVKVNYLPEHVLFNHQRHIKKEIACRQCHGAVETMDRIKKKQFEMGFCVACHREKKANLDCWLACHS